MTKKRNKRNKGMSYSKVAILMVIVLAVGAIVGVGGWIYVTGGSGEASRTINEAIAEADANAQSADNVSRTSVAFNIVAEQSEASFTLEEDLRGVRTTVIGTTREIGGTINVDMANPSTAWLK